MIAAIGMARCRCGAYVTERWGVHFYPICGGCAEQNRVAHGTDYEWNGKSLADRLAFETGQLIAESMVGRYVSVPS